MSQQKRAHDSDINVRLNPSAGVSTSVAPKFKGTIELCL